MATINTTSNSAADQEQLSMPSKYRKTVIAMRRRLQRLNNHLTPDRVQKLDCSALSVHLDSVEQINQTVNRVLYDSDAELEDDLCNEFESLYYDVKIKLARQLNMVNKRDHPRSSTIRQFSVDQSSFVNSAPPVQKPRLPEIQLPNFSGAYQEWPNFFGLFSTVIHENSNLSGLEKLHYLRSCLCDAALDTISSLELSDENYEEAIKLLKKRFDNKLLNFQKHIKEIFSLKVVEKESASALRHLSDKMNSHLRAVRTIATNEQLKDGLLLYLVAAKLDAATQRKWEEGLSSDELPTWDSMAEFLERRCRMLENVENSMVSKAPSHQSEGRSRAYNRHVHVSSAASIPCSFCDSNEHFITNCSLFVNLVPSQRFAEAKRLNLCLNCLKKGHMISRCASGRCRHCSSKHHTMLHFESVPLEQLPMSNSDEAGPTASQSVLISSANSAARGPHATGPVSALLATASVLVKNQFGVYVPCRAILDSASQLNLITSRLVNRLHLKCHRTYATVSGIGDGTCVIDRSVDISAKSRHSDYSTSFTAMVVPTITDYQPSINTSISQWNIPENIQLADPSFDKSGRIDVLIGAELFFDLMSVGQIKMADNLPILQKTLFGWVIAGGVGRSPHSASLVASSSKIKEEAMLSSVLKGFWEVENNFDNNVPYSKDELFCETHFMRNTSRLASGAYSVRLPQNEAIGASSLGGSYERALQRFKSLERKFKRHPDIKASYVAFMREYAELNHMSLISPRTSLAKYFLPHHCVQKLDSTSTKLRVVFDGSAKTTSGLSLNDVLLSGPTIQSKLFNTLLRYRFFKVALSGDICKMYRCVQVSHPDDLLQCILWREDEEENLQTFKLNTVTYGTKPAAFLAIRTMHQLAADEEGRYPLGAKIVRRDFYVDDLISGGDSADEVLAIRQEVAALLQRGGFLIRKWCSNMPEILEGIPSADAQQFLKFHDGTDITKTLGLIWDPKCDNFIFSFSPVDDWKVVTKRSILSAIARLYDPLGLIGPIITKAKIFMQHLWKSNLQWDESLPQSLHTAWLDYIARFSSIHHFIFPRYVSMPQASVQIHAFCDASLDAYGACLYARSELNDIVKTSLLCSKSRVSPLKSLTVPKLELSAAVLLSELLNVVVKELPFNPEIHCWSDSMVVLSWIQEQPSNFNVFVSNRVARIQTLTSQAAWHYVPTDLNPADILSRGATPEQLLQSAIWKSGPQFLLRGPSSWPSNVHFLAELPERRKNILVTSSITDLAMQCKYHNSFPMMQRIFGYVSKFLNFKSRGSCKELTPSDIKLGTHLLIRNIQAIHFSVEYKALKRKENVSSSSKLLPLMPIMDSFGLIRVGGRLQHSSLDFDARHPIILPQHHPFTASLIMHFHQKLLHAGSQTLTASIRQQYWPIGGRKFVNSIASKCLRCFRMKPVMAQHVMGSLPSDRVRPSRAFHTTGVDFCGPFYYKSEVKSRPPVKCYVAIFVCFSTKATHLEVVQDLSTPAFLCSLRRFVATRGKPKTIWSDNATNFVGAKNELAELRQIFFGQLHLRQLHQLCLDDGIEWKFIPPRSPHFGGLWEAAVKSAKLHFFKTVGLNRLTFDELRTLVCQISAILNSRPLCPISEDLNDLDVLTPGHFLVGGPLTSIIEPDMSWINCGHLNSWQRVSELQQEFWKKWSSSYLSLLQERSKWKRDSKNIVCGTIVLIKDENLPPLKWQLGRVVNVIPGEDGVVRVVNVQTSSGLFKRAVSKLAALPISGSVEDVNSSTGGGC